MIILIFFYISGSYILWINPTQKVSKSAHGSIIEKVAHGEQGTGCSLLHSPTDLK